MNTRETSLKNLPTTDSPNPPHSKRCPRCGELLFDDMDVCYGCLYDFTREPYRLPEGMIAPADTVDDVDEPEELATPAPVEMPPQPRVQSVASDESRPRPQMPPERIILGDRRILVRTTELSLGLPLPARGLSVGRAPDNDVVLLTGGVAEHHLVLVPRDGDVVAVGLVGEAFESRDARIDNGCACLSEGRSVLIGDVSLEVGCP